MRKKFLIVCGMICIVIGITGIFLPVLPTTPFLLLAAACFYRSSPRFYGLLMESRVLGTYIRNYRDGKGIPMAVKTVTIIILWVTILVSAILLVHIVAVKIILIGIAATVTIHLMRIKTLEKK